MINIELSVRYEDLAETYGVDLPNNSLKLSKKFKAKLGGILSQEPSLFKYTAILDMDELNAKSLLLALRDIPPHPKLIMHALPPYSLNLNPIERM